MTKRTLSLILCVLMLLGGTALASEAKTYIDAYEAMQEPDWYGQTTDAERIDMAWEILHIFRYAGYPVGHLTANGFAQAMNDYFDWDKEESVWTVALIVLADTLTETGHDAYLPEMNASYYDTLDVSNWYGTTTDDERIAMARDLLNILRTLCYPIAGIEDHELAQAMNDHYDQDTSQSIFQAAIEVLGPAIPDTLPWMPMTYIHTDSALYTGRYEPDWYGQTTDDERIDMAWDLLNILRCQGEPIGHLSPNGFAQAMNDFYDQDKSLSVWEVAVAVLEASA